MDESNRYYYVSNKNPDFSRTYNSRLTYWNKNFTIEVDEDVDNCQYIEISVGKFADGISTKPKNNKYEKVKPILKELFLDHYLLAIKLISKINIDEGEFYLKTSGKDWFQVEFYSTDRKPHEKIAIDYRDDLHSLQLTLIGSSNMSGRPSARKQGVPMTSTHFKQILDLTLKYLFDADSLKVLLVNYINCFKQLSENEVDFEIFKIDDKKILQGIVDQLKQRKQNIEKRLIDNDEDSEAERIKMRGEIAGINYAIEAIKSS